MGILSKLLGTEKLAQTTVKEGFGLLDNAFHTEQEKAADSKEMMAMWLRVQELVHTQSSPTSISRRYISWGIILQMMIVVNVCLVYVCKGDTVTVDNIINVASSLWLGQAFVSVIVFYFGPHVVSAIKKG